MKSIQQALSLTDFRSDIRVQYGHHHSMFGDAFLKDGGRLNAGRKDHF